MNRIQIFPIALVNNYSKKRIIFTFILLSLLWTVISNGLIFGIVFPVPFNIYVDLGIRDLIFVSPIGIFLFFMISYYLDTVLKIDQQYKTLFEGNPNPMWIYDIETLKFEVVN